MLDSLYKTSESELSINVDAKHLQKIQALTLEFKSMVGGVGRDPKDILPGGKAPPSFPKDVVAFPFMFTSGHRRGGSKKRLNNK